MPRNLELKYKGLGNGLYEISVTFGEGFQESVKKGFSAYLEKDSAIIANNVPKTTNMSLVALVCSCYNKKEFEKAMADLKFDLNDAYKEARKIRNKSEKSISYYQH